MFRLASLLFLLMFGAGLARAQTLSNCRATPPPVNKRPSVTGLTLNRRGSTLVVAGGDAKIRLLDLSTGNVDRVLAGHDNAVYIGVFSPDEKILASSSRDSTVRLWDVTSGKEMNRFGGFRCSVKAVGFSPNGALVAASGNDGILRIWDVKTGAELKSLVHKNSPDIDMGIYSFVFTPDGTTIYAGNGDGTISQWDLRTSRETRTWQAHDSAVIKLILSPKHGELASLSFRDGVVKLWQIPSGREIRQFTIAPQPAAASAASALAFNNNGRRIAASDAGFDAKGSSYLYVRATVWNTLNGKQLYAFRDHKFDIDGLVFTRNDRYLVTGSVDTTIKFWDMKTGQLTRTITLKP